MKAPHALIVGGTRGLGRTVTRRLVHEAHVVSVIGRREPAPADRVPGAQYWAADVTDSERLLVTLADVVARQGKLTHLVCLHRYRGDGDDWAGELDTSVTATKRIIDRLAGEFDEAGERSIVLVSSVAGVVIAEEQPISYHVAKAALNQMVRYYAVALGPRGIRVNGVAPGTFLKDESKAFYEQQERLTALYRQIIPLQRMGTADDVAHVVSFLCSAQAAFMTGQILIVDGGLSLRSHEGLARQLAGLGELRVTRPVRKGTAR